MHHPALAAALDSLREIAALIPERNRLQHAANQARAGRRYAMAELSEQSAEQCLTTALALAEQAIDALTRARQEAPL
jgi:hypothetical protein